MKLMLLATVAMVMGVVVMVMSRREEGAEQDQDTHTEARSRIREITNLITSKFQSFMRRPVTDNARSSNIPAPKDSAEEDTEDILKDDVRVFPTTIDVENIDAYVEDPSAHDAKTTSANHPNTVLSDAEESTTSDEDNEDSIYSKDDYEAFLSPEYDVLDDQVSADPSTTPSRDKTSGSMLRFGPVPVAAELFDDAEVEVSAADPGEAEGEVVDVEGDAVDGMEDIDAVDDVEGDVVDGMEGIDAVDDVEASAVNIEGDAVNDVEGDAGIDAQKGGVEGEEAGTIFDTDTTGDSDMPFDTISSDYEDVTDSTSDSDDSDDDDAEAGDGYLSDAFNWYDDYSDYDVSDTDDSSDDMLYLNEGELSDLPDTSDSDDEYDTDSTTSDDEDLAPPDVVEEAGVEPMAVDETATGEAEGVVEVPPIEESTPEAAF